MNTQETAKVLTYLFADHDLKVPPAKVQVWADQFKHVPYEEAIAAARVLVSRKTYGAPKASDLHEALKELRPVTGESWGEAFALWVKIARRCGYYRRAEARARYEALCPLGARALGEMADEFFDLKVEERSTYRAQFRQRYEAIAAREERESSMPPHVALELKRLRDEKQQRLEAAGQGRGQLPQSADRSGLREGDSHQASRRPANEPVRVAEVLALACRC